LTLLRKTSSDEELFESHLAILFIPLLASMGTETRGWVDRFGVKANMKASVLLMGVGQRSFFCKQSFWSSHEILESV
jgi:hypothetical protein